MSEEEENELSLEKSQVSFGLKEDLFPPELVDAVFKMKKEVHALEVTVEKIVEGLKKAGI